MRARAIILVMASAIAPQLAAQQQTSDLIPRELVLALLDRYGWPPSPADVVVGRLPRSFPADAIVRENIRILGGIEGGNVSTVVADVPEPPERAVARVASHLEGAGWRRADEQPMGGGFVPNATVRPTVYCRANAVLAYTVRAREGVAGSRLHLSVSHPDGYSQCTGGGERDQRRLMEFRSTSLPNLESPPGARMSGSGQGSSGPGSREAYTRLETTLSAAAVGEHYAAQLRRAGWTVSAPTQGDEVILYRAQRRDEEKHNLFGVLTVLRVPDTQQLDVAFRAAQVDARR